MTIINHEWPRTLTEDRIKNYEKRIKEKAHEMIQKGKLDLYEYALYIEKQMNLEELKQIVESEIRREKINQLRDL